MRGGIKKEPSDIIDEMIDSVPDESRETFMGWKSEMREKLSQSEIESLFRFANEVTQRIDETNLLGVVLLVYLLGIPKTNEIVDLSIAIFQGEGMLTSTGDRPRTLGGIFFYLAWGAVGPDAKKKYKHCRRRKKKALQLTWDNRELWVNKNLRTKKGKVISMEVTLTGYPTRVRGNDDCVSFYLKQKSIQKHGIPDGLPLPPDNPTYVLVFSVKDDWDKASKMLYADEDSTLFVKGYAQFDPELKDIAVFATQVETVHQP